jgi:hypothetical protein
VRELSRVHPRARQETVRRAAPYLSRSAPALKRRWSLSIDPDSSRAYVARSDRGTEAFFVTSEALVRFSADGELNSDAVRAAIRDIHSGAGRIRDVLLEDP